MKNSVSITKSSSEIIVLLIIYFIILIVIGIIKSNILIDILPTELVNTAKISSYVSIVISSIISAIVIGLIIGMLFFLNVIFDININENNFTVDKMRKDIYHKGSLSDNYFWDFIEFSYEVK